MEQKMNTPKVSVVVSSYGRFEHIKRLVESAKAHFPPGAFEVVAVCSDDPNSEKVQWLKKHSNVRYIQGDIRTTHRLHSLYHYENVGILAAEGEWIFVTNDDTVFDGPFYEELLKHEGSYEVILVKGHVGEPGLGKRIPEIGEIWKPGFDAPGKLYLYDFSIIRTSTYLQIGGLDENLDWFGKGFDLALAIEFTTDARVLHQSNLEIGHAIAPENRNPPDYHRDFVYAQEKWRTWCANNPGYKFSWPW